MSVNAQPNNTASPVESSAVVPDAGVEKSVVAEADPTAASTATVSGVTTAAKPEQVVDSPALAAASSAAATKILSPIQELWAAAKANGHPEIWGVTLADPEGHIPTQIVLQKYLNANDGDLTAAKDQLLKTLEWRAKTRPLELVEKKYNQVKFGGLGYVTTYGEKDTKEVFTWNIYGNVKKFDDTFGNLQEFIDWRVALMEVALKDLSISTATTPITADDDPYKIYQVHDYKSTSFFRSPPSVRAASSETIKVFAQNYPELLKEKFFVNVPAIMGFMYTFMKLFVAAKTIKKFHPMSNGGQLSLEFKESKVSGLGEKLPKEYGGKGSDLKIEGKETTFE